MSPVLAAGCCWHCCRRVIPELGNPSGIEGCGKLRLIPLLLSGPGKRAVVGYEDGTMRIWDLKQGTSLHVLKGREEINHLLRALTWGRAFISLWALSW